jgi:hypothetical protein
MADRASGYGRSGAEDPAGPESPGAATTPGSGPVPAATLRAWDEAEAKLFPLVMARPEEYERSLRLIQALLGQLRQDCTDIPALLTASARGGELAAEAAQLGDLGATAAGPRLGLIAAAACAMRYRELVAETVTAARLARFDEARGGPGGWTVVEEIGDVSRAPYLPYQRVEAHVPSGRAIVISIEPDETLVGSIWRLDSAQLEPGTGRLAIGDPVGSYTSAAAADDALARLREQPG